MDLEASVTLLLRSAPDETFAFVAEPANGPRFDRTIVELRPDPAPMRLGSHNRVRIRGPFGLPLRAESRVVEFEPGRGMTLESIAPAWPTRVRAVHRFEPYGSGTRYVYTVTFTPARFGGLLTRLFASFLRRNMVDAARRLTQLLGAADAPH